MAQLDKLLSMVVANKAAGLTLDEGDLAKLETAAGPRPVTRAPLSAAQVVALLREIAPADAGAQLTAGRPAMFTYRSDDGAFAIAATTDNGQWRVRVRMDEGPPPRRSTPIASASIPTESPMSAAMGGAATAAPAAAPAGYTPPTGRRSIAIDASAIPTFDGSDEARDEIERLLHIMVENHASDLHLRCEEPPMIRKHGEMLRIPDTGSLDDNRLSAMLRSIMPERNRREFADNWDTDFAHEIPGLARFRANALKDRHGTAAVFRQIPAQVVTADELGLSQEVQRLAYLTKGLVLVTGPTGSGKSTTLCGLVDLVNRMRSDHVITIEDPIEFVHENKKCLITQRQVGVHTKSFKSALRAALREDPDIILVGELRDLETVSIAIETAETGHLVFGTLHTTTAAGTIDRLIDQFPADRQAQIRTMLSESLKGVISQTLCKKIGGGRVAAREILLSTPSISNLIREGKTFQIPSILQTSRRLGMVTLNDALLELVDSKLVEPMEAYMKSVEKTGLVAALKQRGHDVKFAEAS